MELNRHRENGMKKLVIIFNNHLDYIACKKDSCIYIKITRNNNGIMIGLFVDDMLVKFNKNDKMNG